MKNLVSRGAQAMFKPSHVLVECEAVGYNTLGTFDIGASSYSTFIQNPFTSGGLWYGLAYDHIAGWLYFINGNNVLSRTRAEGNDLEEAILDDSINLFQPSEMIFSAYDRSLYVLSTRFEQDRITKVAVDPRPGRANPIVTPFAEFKRAAIGGDFPEITWNNAFVNADRGGISGNGRDLFVCSTVSAISNGFLMRLDRYDKTNYSIIYNVSSPANFTPIRCVFDPEFYKVFCASTDHKLWMADGDDLGNLTHVMTFTGTDEIRMMRLDQPRRLIWLLDAAGNISYVDLNVDDLTTDLSETFVNTSDAGTTGSNQRGTLVRYYP